MANPPSAGGDIPLAHRVVRGGLWVMVSSYWQIGFGFAANILLTRLLSPEVFGQFALAIFFAQLLRLQPRLGLGKAFTQHQDTSGRVFGTYLGLEGLAASGTLVFGAALFSILPTFGYSPIIALIGGVLLFSGIFESFGGIGITILDKSLDFKQGSVIHSIAFPLSYVPALWLATHNGGVWSLVSQAVVYNLFVLGGIWWRVLQKLPEIRAQRWRFDRSLAKQFLKFGITVGFWTLAAMLLTHLDNFFIGTFVNETSLGFYDRAYRMAQWPTLLLSGILTRTAFFTYARLQDDSVRLRKTVEMVIWLIMMVAVPVALIIFITAPELLTVLYGERWLPSVPYLRVLVAIAVVRPLWMNANQLFVALGKPKLTLKYNIIQLGILAPLGLTFTLQWGALGTATAVGLALVVSVVAIYRAMGQHIKLILISTMLHLLIATCLTLLLTYIQTFVCPFSVTSYFLNLIVTTLIVISSFTIIIFSLERKNLVLLVEYFKQSNSIIGN